MFISCFVYRDHICNFTAAACWTTELAGDFRRYDSFDVTLLTSLIASHDHYLQTNDLVYKHFDVLWCDYDRVFSIMWLNLFWFQ